MELFNKVVLLKTKYLRANYCSFMTKELSKAILPRARLQNQFLKKGHQKLNQIIASNKR